MSAPLWVVLPVFNEAGALEGVVQEWVRELRARVVSFTILIVDDGSTDESPIRIRELETANREVRSLRISNQGHGQACLHGYRHALDQGAQWLLQIDSDGQCDPADFAEIWEKRKNFDAVFGVRRRRQDGLRRTLISRALSTAVLSLSGEWLPDANVPYRLMTAPALKRALEKVPAGMDLANVGLALALATDPWIRMGWQPISFLPRKLPIRERPFAFYLLKAKALSLELLKMKGLSDSRAMLGLGALLLVGAFIACWMTPRLVGGLWWDTGFWGFVEPIGRRVSTSTPLYGEGLRLPLPPLSFVGAHLLALGTWSGRAWILSLKVAQVAVLGFGLRRLLGGWPCFLAALGTLMFSLASKKALLYDGMVEFWVACWIVALAGRAGSLSRKRAAMAGLFTALALLTKQSTGLGMVALSLIRILWGRKGQEALVWALGFMLGTAFILLILSPWVSLSGMIEQVFLTGSLPKGGFRRLIEYPLNYARDLGWLFLGPIPGRLGWAERFPWSAYWAPACVFVMGLLSVGWKDWARVRMWLLLLGVAAAHSLSVPFFRWSDENYTLFFVGLAFIARARGHGKLLSVGMALILILGLGLRFKTSMEAHADATEIHQEVSSLDGMKVRPRTQLLFGLIDQVRTWATPTDSVLWLPSDPNIEVWLGRPRPLLSSAAIFPDLYWDHWVDQDMDRLVKNPPKVVVIGPMKNWRSFSRLWHPEFPSWGAERLVSRLRRELLPSRYESKGEYEVVHGNGSERELRDRMEVFVRR